MRAIPKLSSKIFLLAFLNLLLLCVVFFIFMRVQYRLDIQSFLFSPAQDRILAVGRQLALELRDTEASGWNDLLMRYGNAHKVEFRLLDEHGMQLAGPQQPLPAAVLDGFTRQNRHRGREAALMFLGTTHKPTQHWIGVRIPIPSSGEHHHVHGALVAASSSFLGIPFFFDPKPWLSVGFAVVLISLICWLPLVRGLTRSISHITRATGQIAEGHFEIELPVNRRDELGQLSASINRMAARLAGFVKGQKRFLGDTAHELCSPIARMQVAVGILERSATADQNCVADLRDDLQHMSELVNDVLSFSKAGMRTVEAQLAEVDVANTIARVLDREANGAQITTAVTPQLRALADPDLLFRALSNVVRNAVRYAGTAGPIEIAARSVNGDVVIRVADFGPGLAEKDLETVFEPFYRPEPARTRETGGTGLGLAIVKTCIESCQGTVHCRNRVPSGLEVEICLKSPASSNPGQGLPGGE